MWHKFKSFLKILPKRKSPFACHGFGVSVTTEAVIYLHIISEKFPLEVGVFLKVAYILPFYKSFTGQREKAPQRVHEGDKLGPQQGGEIQCTLTRTPDLITSWKSIPTFHFFWSLLVLACLFLFFSTAKLFPWDSIFLRNEVLKHNFPLALRVL